MNEQPDITATDDQAQVSTDENGNQRTILVVVDYSDELRAALRYACRRARKTRSRIALLHVIEPHGQFNFMSVGELISDEARAEAEESLKNYAELVNHMSGQLPVIHLREGDKEKELIKLIEDTPEIAVLVLGVSTGPGGPGPLIRALSGRQAGRVKIPVTIVPGSLTDDEIDLLS